MESTLEQAAAGWGELESERELLRVVSLEVVCLERLSSVSMSVSVVV